MAEFLVIAVAVFFLGMGVIALVRPARIVGYFGTCELTVDGRNEVRAVYGGFGIVIAALLAWTLMDPTLAPGVLITVAISLIGMASGRVVSRLIDGAPGFYPALFFFVELGLAGALLLAAFGSA
jgi:hypothetical protein